MSSHHFTSRFMAYAQLTRLDSSLTAAAYTWVGAYLSTGVAHLLSVPVIHMALVVALMVSFSFAFNDYIDVNVDRFGKPERPIPSGRLSRQTAGILAIILALSAVGIAMLRGWWLVALVLGTLTLSTLYSAVLKKTFLIGNVVVAFLDATIVIDGGLAVNQLTPAVWIASALTFLYIFAQEILYTVEDEQGDRQAGLHTAAIWLGPTGALRLFQVLAGLFVAAALLPWLLDLAPTRYLYAIVPCTALPTLVIIIVLGLRITSSTMQFAFYGTWIVWFTSLLPIILLR
jgi:geranylgeranylglycerol-phosphate geranylgeranyltransferase